MTEPQVFIKVENITDESHLYAKWNPWTSIPLFIIQLFAVLVAIIARSALINYMRKAAPDRPINSNIYLDQTIELSTLVLSQIMYLASVIAGKAMWDIFGETGCVLCHTALIIFCGSKSIGSCGLAVYRFLCLHNLGITLNIQRANKLMRLVMRVEVAMEVVFVASLLIAQYAIANPEPLAITFMKGHTKEMANIINQKPHTLPWFAMIIPGLINIGSQVTEMGCYIAIYWIRLRNDTKIKDSIGKDSFKERKRGNVVTLSTQVVCFACETVTVIILGSIASLAIETPAAPEVIMVGTMVSDAIVSIMHVMASNDMRKYYHLN